MIAIHMNLLACVVTAYAAGVVTSRFFIVTNVVACLINVVIVAAALWS
jgi:hypothetical protein